MNKLKFKRLWKDLCTWIHYKLFAKYILQDTAHGFNGDVTNLSVFTPATNTSPPSNWKGNRVEVEERHRKRYKQGEVLTRDFSFTLLDESFLDDVEYCVIHQLWTSGHRMPKYVAYVNKVDGNLYFRIRYAHTGKGVEDYEFKFSSRLPIEVGVEYKVNVTVVIDDSDGDTPEGLLRVEVDGTELYNVVAYTQDPESILLEKYGVYWNREAEPIAKSYPPTLEINLARTWLNNL